MKEAQSNSASRLAAPVGVPIHACMQARGQWGGGLLRLLRDAVCLECCMYAVADKRATKSDVRTARGAECLEKEESCKAAHLRLLLK